MVIQVVRGFLLSLYYNDSVNYAFYSVRYLILEVENGYQVRFIHSTGARVLFFLIFVHIGRGLWYKSYYLIEVWEVGVVIFFDNSCIIFRICASLRSDVFLSSYCYY